MSSALLLLLLSNDDDSDAAAAEAKDRALPRLQKCTACTDNGTGTGTGNTLAFTPTCAGSGALEHKACEKRRRRLLEPPTPTCNPCRSAFVDNDDDDNNNDARERRPMVAARSRTAGEVVMAGILLWH